MHICAKVSIDHIYAKSPSQFPYMPFVHLEDALQTTLTSSMVTAQPSRQQYCCLLVAQLCCLNDAPLSA